MNGLPLVPNFAERNEQHSRSAQGVHTTPGPLSLCNVERSHHRTKHFIRGVMVCVNAHQREEQSSVSRSVGTAIGFKIRIHYNLVWTSGSLTSVMLDSDLVQNSPRCGDVLYRRSIPHKVSSGCAAVPVIGKGVSLVCGFPRFVGQL